MAAAVETAIGRQLAVVSGGNCSSLEVPLGQLPAAITDLRCGDSLLGMIPAMTYRQIGCAKALHCRDGDHRDQNQAFFAMGRIRQLR